MRRFIERLYFRPRGLDWAVIGLLTPLSVLYGAWMYLRRKRAVRKDFAIPIVSVGNLVVGGSGKTPFVIALASRYESAAVVSRGYGRKSEGLLVVSRFGKIETDVFQSGDEAMSMARALPHASVIVSEKREEGIEAAKRMGARVVFMDDGFNRVDIKKYEILLEPTDIPNRLPFPAGPYREFPFTKKYADRVAIEGVDYVRHVHIDAHPYRTLLFVTAISRPQRLYRWLPNEKIVGTYLLEDHAYFDEASLATKMRETGAEAILTTQKDIVKMEGFKLPIVQMRLELEIKAAHLEAVDEYIRKYQNRNER